MPLTFKKAAPDELLGDRLYDGYQIRQDRRTV